MIAALVSDLQAAARCQPRAVDAVCGPYFTPGVAPLVVVTKDGPAFLLHERGRQGRRYAGTVVALSTLLQVSVKCYRQTARGTWTRVRP